MTYRNVQGAVLVELALTVPLLLLLVWGTISVTMMAIVHYRTSVAAHEAAFAVFHRCGGLVGARATTAFDSATCANLAMTTGGRGAALASQLLPLPPQPPAGFPIAPHDHPGEIWQPINVRFFRCPTELTCTPTQGTGPCLPSSPNCTCQCGAAPILAMTQLDVGHFGADLQIDNAFNQFYLGSVGVLGQIRQFRPLLHRRGMLTFATARSGYPSWIWTFGRSYAQETVMY